MLEAKLKANEEEGKNAEKVFLQIEEIREKCRTRYDNMAFKYQCEIKEMNDLLSSNKMETITYKSRVTELNN